MVFAKQDKSISDFKMWDVPKNRDDKH
jgi:hypothetical protein